MPAIRDQLEADLRVRWDREMLAVYADHLEASGDPRGELISIDLRIDEVGETTELVEHRRMLIDRWFGFQPPGVRHGFVDIDATSADPVRQLELLDGPAAPFVRSIIIVGAPATIERALVKLAETRRPWLVKLTIRQWAEKTEPVVTGATFAKLVTASPHLATLEVDGRRVFGQVAHPKVRHLRISGFDALASLGKGATAHAGVTSLDFAFHCHLADSHEKVPLALLADLLPIERFPSLTSLDLSRCEPGHLDPVNLGGSVDVLGFLAQHPIRTRIVSLHLPSLRFKSALDKVRKMIDVMPMLESVTIRRGTDSIGETLTHERVAVTLVQ